MNGSPVLVTERLALWRPQADDRPLIQALLAPPAVRQHLGPKDDDAGLFARLLRNAGSWELYGYGTFVVRERGSSAVVGSCGIFHSWRGLGDDFDDKPEAGWIIAESHFGKGVAREAMDAALAWFDREHGPREIVCMISPENAPSIRLAERLGFSATREAILSDGDPIRLFRRASPL